MKRALLLFAWLVLGISMAHAVPARPLYEPPEPPKAQSTPVLAGEWTGTLFLANCKITFHADGTLHYGDPTNGSPGSWKLDGVNLIFFEINKYSEYKAVVHGDFIDGTGQNKAGQTCMVRLQRVAPGQPVLPLPKKVVGVGKKGNAIR